MGEEAGREDGRFWGMWLVREHGRGGGIDYELRMMMMMAILGIVRMKWMEVARSSVVAWQNGRE